MRNATRLVLVLLVLSTLMPPAAAKKTKAQDLLLPRKLPEVTEAERKLTEVPFAKGAPAVVLLDAEQNEWDQGLKFRRIDKYLRIKILTPDGIETYGDQTIELYGDWRVKKVDARTVLADGTTLEAEDVFHEKSDSGRQELRIAFPRVEVGAILDFHLTINGSPWGVSSWRVQREIPVLDSRFIMKPPRGLRFRQVPYGMDPSAGEPLTANFGAGLKAYVWRFENVEPLPQEPNAPPVDEIAQKLIMIMESYKDAAVYIPIATDWKSFIADGREYWEDWIKSGHGSAAALARQVAAEGGTPLDKAEAVRRAVRDRVRVDYLWDYPVHDSPDEVLSEGSGNSADRAGLCVAMLRELGVDADLVAIRRRDYGVIFREIPIPAMLNDILVMVPGKNGPTYFSPAAELSVGRLPWNCTGLLAVPYAKGAKEPVIIPDLGAEQNRIVRTARLEVAAEGTIRGESEHRLTGVAGEELRRALADLDPEARKLRIQSRLRRWLGGAELTSFEIENLDEVNEDLVVRCEWQVGGYAMRAGQRLLVNPNPFSRISATDWPPGERVFPVYLERPVELIDEVTLAFPEDIEEIETPEKVELDAGPAGFYRQSTARRGNTIVAKRHLRLNLYTFGPQEYGELRRWFISMAEADDRPAVAKLP